MSKFNKLLTMNPREVAYRVHEKFRSESERLRHYVGFDRAPRGDVFAHFKNYLVEQAAPRFYFQADGNERDQRMESIRLTYPQWIDQAVQRAERICEHKVQLLGFGEVDLGADIDWHRDPITGQSWPRRFWSDYDLVQDSGAGDPKVIHELNRHQHVVDLAKAYFLARDERYATEAVAQMNGWIEQNPTSMGINWQSSLEISIRAVSWLWTIFLLLPSRSLTDEAATRIGRSLFAQIDHVDRFPSLFSSPNTHLISEATALFVAGTAFQGVSQASRWQRKGADWLIREMEQQVTEDGVHAELSSYYHCYTVDFFLQALTLSTTNGFKFPEWMWTRLDQMMAFLGHLSRNDGTLPLLGDDDGGRALAIVSGDYRSWKFDEEIFWLGGAPTPRLPQAETHAFYPAAGYAIQRSGWEPQDSQVIFDCGGLGMLNGGHGHADALSLVLSVGPTEILRDSGTCVYNGQPEWRDFFRSTRAHNTVVVDDANQSIPDGTFKWRTKAQTRIVQHLSSDVFDYIEAEHDGYSAEPCNIVHRRRLLHVLPGLWVAVDDLQGPSQSHRFDSYFHFPSNAKLTLQQESSSVIRLKACADAATLQLLMCASGAVQATAYDGQLDPIQGWVSAKYGEKTPATTVQMRMQTVSPASGMFLMVPSHADAEPNPAITIRPLAVTGGSALASKAECGDIEDIFVSSVRDQHIRLLDFTLRGRFFWIRKTGGSLTHILGIDCKEVRHLNEILTLDSKPGVFSQGLRGLRPK